MFKYLPLLTVLLLAVACSGTPDRGELKKIKLIEQKDLERCQVLDVVNGVNEKGLEALAIEDAKAQALKLEADSLYVHESVANGSKITIKASAYQCKK